MKRNRTRSLPGSRRAFVLIEVMLGVAIFAIGIFALGEAVNNCIVADSARADDQRARMALESAIAQVEAGAVQLGTTRTEKLTGAFEGITITEKREPLTLKNEKNEPLTGLYSVNIQADWTRGSQPQSKTVTFYVFRSH